MRCTIAIASMVAMGCGEALPAVRNTTIVQKLGLARETEAGVSVGFNVDAQVSTSLDFRTCNKEDFVDPDGLAGIDNQMARLLPLIDAAGQGAVDALVQAAIGEGRLLMFMMIDEVPDDPESLEVIIERGQDQPLVGGDGLLLAGQTLARHPVPDLGRTTARRQPDGSIIGGPFALRLPIRVFTFDFELDLPETFIRVVPEDDGGHSVVLGGWTPIEEIVEIARRADERGNQFVEAFGPGIVDTADLRFDPATGQCGAMSLAAMFRTVPAFQF